MVTYLFKANLFLMLEFIAVYWPTLCAHFCQDTVSKKTVEIFGKALSLCYMFAIVAVTVCILVIKIFYFHIRIIYLHS